MVAKVSPSANPEAAANAAGFVPQADDVFARIAGRYDRLCDVFSLFAHRLWKERMARRIASAPGWDVLDVASGTGDIPYRLLRQGGAPRRVVVSDVCPEMLTLARVKLDTWASPPPQGKGDHAQHGGGGPARIHACRPNSANSAEQRASEPPPAPFGRSPSLCGGGDRGSVTFAHLDAHDLAPVPSASVDVYSISFAMKICDRHRVVAEAFRVLRPGGLFLCLEAGHIPVGWVQAAYLAYMRRCIPAMGWIATRDPSSYGYLLRGIGDFPSQPVFARELGAAGFRDVAWENLTFGIVALHSGVKPL